jgi:hypothetical protein
MFRIVALTRHPHGSALPDVPPPPPDAAVADLRHDPLLRLLPAYLSGVLAPLGAEAFGKGVESILVAAATEKAPWKSAAIPSIVLCAMAAARGRDAFHHALLNVVWSGLLVHSDGRARAATGPLLAALARAADAADLAARVVPAIVTMGSDRCGGGLAALC